VDVYSIYRETRSSDTQGASERHYAGWSADRDNAKRRAEEIYEGRDSAEAVVVIGNGPAGVEVLYRMDGED
jgi:NADH dehydrogenase FAD-containing subunit